MALEESTYLDDHMANFSWPVNQGGYYWEEEASAKHFFGGIDRGPFLLEQFDTIGGYRPSHPLSTDPLLFIEFAQLTLSPYENATADQLLDFASKYGKLRLGREITSTKENRVFNPVYGDSLFDWVWTQRIVAILYDIWDKTKWHNSIELSDHVHWTNDKSCVKFIWPSKKDMLAESEFDDRGNQNIHKRFLEDATVDNYMQLLLLKSEKPWYGNIASNAQHPEVFARFRINDIIGPIRFWVQRQINVQLKEEVVNAKLLWNKDNNIELYFVPTSLIAAMWFQFARYVAGETKFKRCAVCNRFEDVTEKRSSWTMHKQCSQRRRLEKWKNGKGDDSLD